MNDTLELILEELKRLNRQNADPLWDAQDIADHLGLAKSTVQSHVLCKPDFPAAFKVSGGSRRWDPEEVKKWARKRREDAA